MPYVMSWPPGDSRGIHQAILERRFRAFTTGFGLWATWTELVLGPVGRAGSRIQILMRQMTASSSGECMTFRITTVSGCNLKASCFATCRSGATVRHVLLMPNDRGDSGMNIAQGSFGVRARTLASCTDPCNTKRTRNASTTRGSRLERSGCHV